MQVLEYCEHHRGERLATTDSESQDETRKRTTDIGEWDQKFIAVDQELLFEIILAANYLDIKPLLSVLFLNVSPDGISHFFDSDVGCKTVANMIKGKTPEEIRKLFNIVNDFTPEEEVRNQSESYLPLANIVIGPDQEGEREFYLLFPSPVLLTFWCPCACPCGIRNGPKIAR